MSRAGGRAGAVSVATLALALPVALAAGCAGPRTHEPTASSPPAEPVASGSSSVTDAPLGVAAPTASTVAAIAAEAPLAPGEPRVVAVATGAYHSCVLLDDGTVRCAGNNDHGQLGLGRFDGDKHPVLTPVPGLRDIVQIAAGWTHTCAVDRAASVHCWGDDSTWLAGPPRPARAVGWGTPRVVPVPLLKAKQLAFGVYRSVALTTDGDVVSWGQEQDGPDRCPAGQGPPRPCALQPMSLAPPAGVVEVAANALTTCVRTRTGDVLCRGHDLLSTDLRFAPKFSRIEPIRDALAIVVGDEHGCAAVRRGPVLCWGRNDDGQLGNGRRDDAAVRVAPAPVVGLRGDEVAPGGLKTGFHRTCAALRDGTVRCWGAQTTLDGAFDYYSQKPTLTPVRVPGLAHVAELATATSQSCAVTRAGRALCWGENENGEVADGTREKRSLPVPVAFVTPRAAQAPVADRSVHATSVVTSGNHSCATAKDGRLRCWGSNVRGELGLGRADSDPHPLPALVPGLARVVRVAVAEGRTCALEEGGALYCWGDNAWGAVGDGTGTPRAAPVRIALQGVTDVALGALHGCAIAVDGRPHCWGEASQGQLGFDPKGCPHSLPSDFALGPPAPPACLPSPSPPVPAAPVADRLLSSSAETCAVSRATRELHCWGTTEPGHARASTRLPALRDVSDARAGQTHACALSKQGEVWCWGKSSYGELGTGLALDARQAPARVRAIANAKRIWVGEFTSCAAFEVGPPKCWGTMPDLGNRSAMALAPVAVPELEGAIDATFSLQHACALWGDGVVRCWGYSPIGAHGGGTGLITTPTPVRWQ